MRERTPVWMTILIIIFLCPVFSVPYLLDNITENAEAVKFFVWGYPFYMLLSAWLAWTSYPLRSYVSWILLVLMAVTTAVIFTIVLDPGVAIQ